MYEDDDEDERREMILQALGGEVDDFAGSKLEDPNKPSGGQGVTIEISVKPHGGPGDEAAKEEFAKEEAAEPEHEGMGGSEDHIAHILGMCGGGCAYCGGGKVA